MTATISTSGANTTITLAYTAPNATMLSVVGAAAEYLFNHGYGNHGTEESPIVFADLTNQQKVNLVEAHVKDVIINAANTHKSIAAQDAAREAEEENKYSL